jgi:hypothetical protein
VTVPFDHFEIIYIDCDLMHNHEKQPAQTLNIGASAARARERVRELKLQELSGPKGLGVLAADSANLLNQSVRKSIS